MKSRDSEFLYEIGTLRFIDRTWRQFLNKNFANLAEHMLRVSWIAMIIAKHENADLNKIVKMALVHDIAESRTGDRNYLQRSYAEHDEEQGIKDMLKDTSLEEEFLDLISEYELRESLESKIVKDADNIDVDIEIKEQLATGYQTPHSWIKSRKSDVRDHLYTESAKKLWDSLQETDPHAWHVNAPHRYKK